MYREDVGHGYRSLHFGRDESTLLPRSLFDGLVDPREGFCANFSLWLAYGLLTIHMPISVRIAFHKPCEAGGPLPGV